MQAEQQPVVLADALAINVGQRFEAFDPGEGRGLARVTLEQPCSPGEIAQIVWLWLRPSGNLRTEFKLNRSAPNMSLRLLNYVFI